MFQSNICRYNIYESNFLLSAMHPLRLVYTLIKWIKKHILSKLLYYVGELIYHIRWDIVIKTNRLWHVLTVKFVWHRLRYKINWSVLSANNIKVPANNCWMIIITVNSGNFGVLSRICNRVCLHFITIPRDYWIYSRLARDV